MNNIPLPKSNKKEDIDTTIIAIKNYLDDLRRQLGLDESETTDLSGYATKAELESAVNTLDAEIEGLNPVDVVEVDNLKAVTSNAVAKCLSYSTTEHKTGEVWIDGKPIYRKVVNFGNLPNNTEKRVSYNISNLKEFVRVYGIAYRPTSGNKAYMPLPYPFRNLNSVIDLYADVDDRTVVIGALADRSAMTAKVILEYTKTTD